MCNTANRVSLTYLLPHIVAPGCFICVHLHFLIMQPPLFFDYPDPPYLSIVQLLMLFLQKVQLHIHQELSI